MEETKYIQKCVTIRKEQELFLINEENFKLSKFLQSKLDDYITLRKEYSQFMEDKNETKTK